MLDCHIHLERGPYTISWLEEFVKTAVKRGLHEIYLLEHSHRFIEFSQMYKSIIEYSSYQKEWFLSRTRDNRSIKEYIVFIEKAKTLDLPIKIKFGLEVCYFEEHEKLIKSIAELYHFDFITGSIHWVDGFGFDHKKELWNDNNVNRIYKRYYELMLRLVKSDLFSGLAHPDSIKAFGHKPTFDVETIYSKLADTLLEHDVYAEQSGGLHLNYSRECELGMNGLLLRTFINKGVRLLTASDAHRPEDVGANIPQLNSIIENCISTKQSY